MLYFVSTTPLSLSGSTNGLSRIFSLLGDEAGGRCKLGNGYPPPSPSLVVRENGCSHVRNPSLSAEIFFEFLVFSESLNCTCVFVLLHLS